jgi:hypothetical protein
MTTAAHKNKIKTLVEKETNVQKLELVLSLLTQVSIEVAEPSGPYALDRKGKAASPQDIPVMRGLKETIAASERQFADGKGIPLEQFEQEMDGLLDELYADPTRMRG